MSRAVVVAWARVGAVGGGPDAVLDGVRADVRDGVRNDALEDVLDGVLDDTELSRAGRYHVARDRAQFVTGAALVRAAAAILVGAPATGAGVRIDRTCSQCGAQHGPPRIVDAPWAHLSVTHAGGVVGLAVGVAGRLGIDVEPVGLVPGDALLATTCSDRERALVAAADDPAREFARLWTRKEALLKALGTGLSTAPETVDVTGSASALVAGSWRPLRGPGDSFASALFVAAPDGETRGVDVAEHTVAVAEPADPVAEPAVPVAEYDVDLATVSASSTAWSRAVAALRAER